MANHNNQNSFRTTLFDLPLDSKGIRRSLKTKFQTLNNWAELNISTNTYRKKKMDLGQDIFNVKKNERYKNNKESQRSYINQNMTSNFFFDINQLKKTERKKSKRISLGNDDIEMKLLKRERLKKEMPPVQIIKYYITNQQLQPKQQQIRLLQALFKIQPTLQKCLKNNELNEGLELIYQILTLSVDLNQMNFFCLLIELLAQICFFMQDYNKSFYFYDQSRLASTYNKNFQLKINALIGMSENANKLDMHHESLIFLKKSLQYAWLANNRQKQLLIYDLMGLNYYYLGNLNKANYFHTRFTLGAYQNSDSVIRLISAEILQQYNSYTKVLEIDNLSSLFLEYLKLPIKGINQLPVQSNRVYNNYSRQKQSPRRRKTFDSFRDIDFDAKILIKNLLAQDKEFFSQIPNPTQKDVSTSYVTKYKRKSMIKDNNVFERTAFYQKHFNKPLEYDHDTTNVDLYKFPLENLIKNRLNRNSEVNWYQKFRQNLKLKKVQIQDIVKDKVITKHLHKEKELDENDLKTQRLKHLNQSYNGVILDYLDPISNYKKK